MSRNLFGTALQTNDLNYGRPGKGWLPERGFAWAPAESNLRPGFLQLIRHGTSVRWRELRRQVEVIFSCPSSAADLR